MRSDLDKIMEVGPPYIMDKTQKENIKKFLSEIQVLKRVKHEGMRFAGVENPDSIAEHSAISAQIAYLLGQLEGADAEKCALINLFHDNEEIRIGDHHKIASRYLNTNEAEIKAEKEHYSNLPLEMAKELFGLQEEKRKRNTKEGIIAQDADWLEVALKAKVYLERGYKGCQVWIDRVEEALETESAKRILAEIKKEPDFINCWWRGLEKMTYKKLKRKPLTKRR